MYHIIANPVAGQGLSLTKHLPQLVAMFDKYNLEHTHHITQKANHAYELAKQLCQKYQEYQECPRTGIIGIGGDGTIQEIVAGMVDASPTGTKLPLPLGVFPGGSGNDFAMAIEGGKKSLKKKIKKGILVEGFVDRIYKQNLRTVDLITANGEAYLVAGNIGIDARIVHDALKLKAKFGGQAYLVAAYKSIINHKNIPMTLLIDGKTIKKEFTLVAICNNNTYGGGLPIAPSAKYDDGKITLCMVDGMSRLKLGVLFPSLLLKKHVHLKAINFIDCEEVEITIPSETLCLDGNLSPQEGILHFKILPQVLDVFA